MPNAQRELQRLIVLGQTRSASECIRLTPIHSLARQAWINAICVVLGFHVLFGEPRQAAADEKPSSKTHQPIPTEAAPEELKRLITDGNVTVVYDADPEFVELRRGWADFQVRLTQSFKYNLIKTRQRDHWRIKLVVTKLEPKIELTHLIRIPASFKSAKIWQSTLLRHEFDHVAVSLDPRAMLLLRHLLAHLPVIERTLKPGEEPTDERLSHFINEEVELRQQAVVDLMRQNNKLLDKVGSHGTLPVPDRAAFFAKLYSKENLAEQKFRYIDQVLKLLETKDYHNAHLRFQSRDPTE